MSTYGNILLLQAVNAFRSEMARLEEEWLEWLEDFVIVSCNFGKMILKVWAMKILWICIKLNLKIKFSVFILSYSSEFCFVTKAG